MSAAINNEDFTKLLREKVETGDPEFQFQVGKCYDNGTGITQSYTEAVKWYRLAAEKDHREAQFELGRAYGFGLGAEKNLEEAVKWYERSAKQGYAPAQNDLAWYYQVGRGVPQDYDEALRLYSLAAEQGHWAASRSLGDLYYAGNGVRRDLIKAKAYYEKALTDSDFADYPVLKIWKKRIQEKIDKVTNELAEIEKKAAAACMPARTEVFVSYAHKDEKFRKELHPHLKMLENTTAIKWWDDTRIKSGEEWNKEIKAALSKAKVAILMVSANFFASEYVWREELPELLAAADENGATILWLLISACAYEGIGVGKYEAVADPSAPLDSRTRAERNKVYTNLVRRIKELYQIKPEQ